MGGDYKKEYTLDKKLSVSKMRAVFQLPKVKNIK